MENREQANSTDKIMAFDTIFTNNHIKMLKVLVFYLDSPLQNMLAVYIKFLELQHAMKYINANLLPLPSSSSDSSDSYNSILGILGNLDVNALCREILPFCTGKESDKVQNILQMYQMMDNFKQISQTMEMMKELFPEGTGAPEDLFSFFGNTDTGSMGNMGNMDMFQMFASMMNNADFSE